MKVGDRVWIPNWNSVHQPCFPTYHQKGRIVDIGKSVDGTSYWALVDDGQFRTRHKTSTLKPLNALELMAEIE